MKTLVTILLSIFTISATSQIQLDSTYYFNSDGSKNWWYIQKDVFSFRCNNGSSFSGSCNPTVVDSVRFYQHTTRKQNEALLNPNSTTNQRMIEMNSLDQSGQVEFTTIAVTQNKATQEDYTQRDYKRTDDIIMVNFANPNVTQQAVDSFMQRNLLLPYHTPSVTLPTASWTYGFKIDPEKWANTFDACRTIFLTEQGLITRCEPNIEELFQPDAFQPISEFNDFDNSNAPDADETEKTEAAPIAEDPTVSIYPNPTNDMVTVSYTLPNASGTVYVSLFNLMGQKLKEITAQNANGAERFSIKKLPNAVYVVTIKDEQGVQHTGKLVVQH